MSQVTPKLFMAVGAATVGLGLVLFASAPRWVQATGTVIAVRVNTDQGRMSGGFQPLVMYSYQVDGRHYHADTIWCGPESFRWRGSRVDALADAARIKVGDPLPIIYSEGSPEDSTCLLSTAHWWRNFGALGALLFGSFFFVVGARDWATARSGAS